MTETKKFGRNRFVRSPQQLLALLFLLFIAPHTHGQARDTLSTDSLHFQLSVPSITLNAGDSVVVTVILGSATSPINAALAFDLSIDLTEKAQFQANPPSSMNDSWFDPDALCTVGANSDSSAGTIRLTASRPSTSPASGHGDLVQFTLVSAENNVHAADLLGTHAGGIIIVDNLEMKRGLVSAQQRQWASLHAYPNPFQDRLSVKLPEEQEGQVELLDLQGKVVFKSSIQAGPNEELYLGNLPEGTYLLRAISKGELLGQQRLIRRKQ